MEKKMHDLGEVRVLRGTKMSFIICSETHRCLHPSQKRPSFCRTYEKTFTIYSTVSDKKNGEIVRKESLDQRGSLSISPLVSPCSSSGQFFTCHTWETGALILFDSIATSFPVPNESRVEQFAERFSGLWHEFELCIVGNRWKVTEKCKTPKGRSATFRVQGFPLEHDWFSINTIQFTIFSRLREPTQFSPSKRLLIVGIHYFCQDKVPNQRKRRPLFSTAWRLCRSTK